MKIGTIYHVARCGDNRRDGLDHNGDIHYLRTIQKAINIIVRKGKGIIEVYPEQAKKYE